MASQARPLRVVVCGAVFGQVYLEAFRPRGYPIELAGILARGSARAAACARHYGVPLFTAIDDLPREIDAACVVVRGRILGGKGTELAHALLRRGLHVIQEHPVHPDELAESLRIARASGVQYRLNSFYVNVGPVRRFMGAVRELSRSQRPLFVDAACGCQLSFSLLEMLAMSLRGVRPWSIDPPRHRPGEPFVTVTGLLAGVPFTIRIQNQLDPADPDGYSYFLHRVDIGFAPGSLALVDTHGPVVWTPRPQFPHEVRQLDATPQFASAPIDAPRTQLIGPAEAPSFEEIFRDLWPAGVLRALLDLRRAIADRRDPLRDGQALLSVAELWRDMLALVGPPELVRGEPIQAAGAAALEALRQAGAELERLPCP
jgi:pyochelin biosynthetic protein PchG